MDLFQQYEDRFRKQLNGMIDAIDQLAENDDQVGLAYLAYVVSGPFAKAIDRDRTIIEFERRFGAEAVAELKRKIEPGETIH